MKQEHSVKSPKRLLMTGGGTLGPVTPLLAIAQEWMLQEDVEVFWIGTKNGPERALVESMHIPFASIIAVKLDRSQWWKWVFIPFGLLIASVQAILKLREIRPDIVFTAGGYVSVPIIIMARIFGIKTWVHQLDILPGLANRVMALFAHNISVTWDKSLDYFAKKKTQIVGGVVRHGILHGDRHVACERYGFSPDKPIVLVLGGGTGAASINTMMEVLGSDLCKSMQILHLTGKGKMTPALERIHKHYNAIEFLGAGMEDAFALADIVVSRVGMGTIIELCALKKPTIFLPIENTDQQANAKMIEQRHAGRVLWSVNPQILKQEIEKLVQSREQQKRYARNISSLFSVFGASEIVKRAK